MPLLDVADQESIHLRFKIGDRVLFQSVVAIRRAFSRNRNLALESVQFSAHIVSDTFRGDCGAELSPSAGSVGTLPEVPHHLELTNLQTLSEKRAV